MARDKVLVEQKIRKPKPGGPKKTVVKKQQRRKPKPSKPKKD